MTSGVDGQRSWIVPEPDGGSTIMFDPPIRIQLGPPIELRPRYLRWLPARTESLLERADAWGHERLPGWLHALTGWPFCDGLDLLLGCPIRELARGHLRSARKVLHR